MSPPSRQRELPGLSSPIDVEDPPRAKDSPSTAPVDTAAQPSAESLRGRTVYVLDSHALIFQVFHALPEMSSPRGEPVGALYGFVRDLLYVIEEKKPDYLFCAFDMPGPTFRHAIFEDYKANRGEMPEELATQFPHVHRVLEALGVPALAVDRYEADDILATVARICEELEMQCFLVTSDKDCRQLISDHVNMYDVRKDEILNAAGVEQDWGIRPDQVVDYQALVGDSTDNVPGVPQIGPKTARELLEKYETLDGVLDHASEVRAPQRRKNLIEGRPLAEMSRHLVRLDRDVPIQLDWNAARIRGFDRTRLESLFAEFGFRSFGEKVRGLAEQRPAAKWKADYQIVDTPEKLSRLVAQMAKQPQISLDTETTNVWPRWAELVGYSFCWTPGEAYYVPVRAPVGDACLDPQLAADALRAVLEDPTIEKVGQNLKYDMVVLRGLSIELAGVTFDTMVASYLLDAGERNHGLDELSQRYLSHTPIPIRQLIGSGKQQKRMDEVAVTEVGTYAAEDADIPLRLRPLLDARLREDELETLFDTVEIPLVEVLVELEFNGIRVDVDRLAELSAQYGQRLDALQHEIHELAGHALNIASPKQLAQVLFDELGLPVIKKTKTGASTDAEVLGQLARLHPLPAKIIEYRHYAKLKNTYVDALPQMVHPTTGRVHASFNQVVAATGRLSCGDPNLQNIPVRSERGREIRSAFLPKQGWKLLAADYSQIELRVLAHFSGDEALSEAFVQDEDVHARVASEVYDVLPDAVTPEMRRSAKAVNFGVIYGQSAFGLATALEIEQEEAARFIDSYFDGYPGVEKFLTKTLEACRKTGYVKTILGRRRAIRGVRAGTGRGRNLAERTAINTVIQGSAADLIKLAMIHIHRRLRREQLATRMLLQIHDELIFEVPSDELEYVGRFVAEEMAGVLELAVPLKVDLKSGENWADCEPW